MKEIYTAGPTSEELNSPVYTENGGKFTSLYDSDFDTAYLYFPGQVVSEEYLQAIHGTDNIEEVEGAEALYDAPYTDDLEPVAWVIWDD